MAREIERKFLLANADWRQAATGSRPFRQGYLAVENGLTVRVRLIGADRARLTLKAGKTGLVRDEFEYDIPRADGEALLLLSGGHVIEKVRYDVPVGASPWTIDVFSGRHSGLVMAEIELDAEDAPFERPSWLGREVTDDPRYANANLAHAAKPPVI